MRGILILLIAAGCLPAQTLRIYAIDVEGGKATLYVSPSGESMLVDTGWGDRTVLGLDPKYANPHRDTDRIVAAAKAAGVKQIDYLVITHFHGDHAGGVAPLADRMPIKAIYDHGERTAAILPTEGPNIFAAYSSVRQKYQHIVVKAGDTIPVKGLRVDVIAAAGEVLSKPLAGAGQLNPLCAGYKPELSPGENPQSLALVITLGKLRIADLGDLSLSPEKQLTCPVNKVGTVDLYMTAHHGGTRESAPEILHALRPRVAIMNNFDTHGGSAENWASLHTSPGFLDLWQLHYSPTTGKAGNSPDEFIANPDVPCEGKWIEVSATGEGTFTVRNSRNGYEKTYRKQE